MNTAPFYRARPIRARRTRGAITTVRDAILRVLGDDNPMTVRQVFYRLVSEGVIAKTEAEYKQTVVRLLTTMRREGELPFGWIADNTRWMRKPQTFSSLDAMLHYSTQTYRRALWDEQAAYVEVWLEKDALAGVLVEETEKWDVPLMVTRGYPSITFLHSAAEAIAAKGKPTYLYYFGDHDPSGIDIPRKVEKDLRAFAPGAEIHFQRQAVLPWQISFWSLPTRPTKTSDSRSKGFSGESVEVDALPSRALRGMVSDCITRHVDPDLHERMLAIEEQERQTLAQVSAALTS